MVGTLIGEAFAYGLSALSAIGAIIFGLKQASTADRSGIATRLQSVEDDLGDCNKRLQMLERREVVHERREGVLLDTLSRHNIEVPELPPFPEAWSA